MCIYLLYDASTCHFANYWSESIRQCLYFWEPALLNLPSCDGDLEYRKKSSLEKETYSTIIVKVTFKCLVYIAVCFEWVATYVDSHLGTIHDIYVSQIRSDYCDILILRSNYKSGAVSSLTDFENYGNSG